LIPFSRRGVVDRLVFEDVTEPRVEVAVRLVVAAALRFDVWARRLFAFDCPATPCARLRCAPSAAAREKLRPHSGQTNSPDVAAFFDPADPVAFLLARFFVLAELLAVAISTPHLPMGSPTHDTRTAGITAQQ